MRLRKRNAVVARNTTTINTAHPTNRITAVVDYYVRDTEARPASVRAERIAWLVITGAQVEWPAMSERSESNGGCSSGVERLTVAQEVAGSRPVTRPI